MDEVVRPPAEMLREILLGFPVAVAELLFANAWLRAVPSGTVVAVQGDPLTYVVMELSGGLETSVAAPRPPPTGPHPSHTAVVVTVAKAPKLALSPSLAVAAATAMLHATTSGQKPAVAGPAADGSPAPGSIIPALASADRELSHTTVLRTSDWEAAERDPPGPAHAAARSVDSAAVTRRDTLGVGGTFGAAECGVARWRGPDGPAPRYPATLATIKHSVVALWPGGVYARLTARAVCPLSLLPLLPGSTTPGVIPGASVPMATVTKLLAGHLCFEGGRPGAALSRTLASCTVLRFGVMAPIMTVGEASPCAYLVLSGSAVILGGVPGAPPPLLGPSHIESVASVGTATGLLCPGDGCGAEALWGAPRPFTVLAREPCFVLALPGAVLAGQAGVAPPMGPVRALSLDKDKGRDKGPPPVPGATPGPSAPARPLASPTLRAALLVPPATRTEDDLASIAAAIAAWPLGAALSKLPARLHAALCRAAQEMSTTAGGVIQCAGAVCRACVLIEGTATAHGTDAGCDLDGAGVTPDAPLPHGPWYRVLGVGDTVGLDCLATATDPSAHVFDPFDDGAIGAGGGGAAPVRPVAAHSAALARLLSHGSVVAASPVVRVIAWAAGDVEAAVSRFVREATAAAVGALSLCARLSRWRPDDLGHLLPHLSRLKMPRGGLVCGPGGPPLEWVYVIRSGVALEAISRDGSGGETPSAGISTDRVDGGGGDGDAATQRPAPGRGGAGRFRAAATALAVGRALASRAVSLPAEETAAVARTAAVAAPGAGVRTAPAGRNDVIGYTAVLLGMPSPSTVVALGALELWRLPAAVVRHHAPARDMHEAKFMAEGVMGSAFSPGIHAGDPVGPSLGGVLAFVNVGGKATAPAVVDAPAPAADRLPLRRTRSLAEADLAAKVALARIKGEALPTGAA